MEGHEFVEIVTSLRENDRIKFIALLCILFTSAGNKTLEKKLAGISADEMKQAICYLREIRDESGYPDRIDATIKGVGLIFSNKCDIL